MAELDPMPAEDTESRGADDAAAWQPVARGQTFEMVVAAAIEEQILSGTLRVVTPCRRNGSWPRFCRSAARRTRGPSCARSAGGGPVGGRRGPGAGTFVASMPSEALTHFLRLHIALSNFAVADIVDARVTLESSSVALARPATGSRAHGGCAGCDRRDG